MVRGLLVVAFAGTALGCATQKVAPRPPVIVPIAVVTSAAPQLRAQTQVANTPPRRWAGALASPQQVLRWYLDNSLGGRHGVAYALLARQDKALRSRAHYIASERQADRLRNQVSALGTATYRISWLGQGSDTTTAIVHVTTGLGTVKMRFVLVRENDSWRVHWARSWQVAE